MDAQKWHAPRNDALSKRAVEILHLLAEGMSDREVAERLIMTTNTVKWYNRQIYSILGVSSRTQAIARARELQLLQMETEAAPPARSLMPDYHLPVEATRFIGREDEMAAIQHLMDSAHLLTLVGPPGTGKTRLALQIAWNMAGAFQHGVYFVSLAPLSDASMVTHAIASAIGVNEAHGRSLLETLKLVLRDRHLLLVLDNFEHLLPAATQISELLTAAPNLNVLATSREPLHLYGEQEYAVPPMQLPDPENLRPQALADCESIALFVQQAKSVRPDFELTPDNILDIAKICVRLEGLPLAIELAAARIKLLTPRLLLNRLESRLNTLIGGAQDVPARHQTLRNTIDWSYNLLSDGEKRLFARLAVFQGGCSLDAIEAVCGDMLPVDVFEGIISLVDKSLIRQTESTGGEPRVVMLETIHEYAWEQLRASGEAPTLHRRHAAYFVQLAELAAPELRHAGFPYWMNRLENEDNNLPTALEWALEDDDIEPGLRLVTALRDFWIMSSRFMQAETWTQCALAKSKTAAPHLRVGVLTAAGIVLYYSSGQRALQKRLLQEAVELARTVNDRVNLAWALTFLGIASIGQTVEYEEAMALTEEGLDIFRQLNHKPGMAQNLNTMGELMRNHGDDMGAQAAYEACLRLVRETGEKRREAMCLNNLGCVMMHRGEVQQARVLFRKALIKRREVGHDKRGCLTNILFLAGAIAATGEPERAARLFGAARALLEPMSVGLEPGDQPEYERDLVVVRAQLDEATFQMRWQEGRGWSLEQTAAYALADA